MKLFLKVVEISTIKKLNKNFDFLPLIEKEYPLKTLIRYPTGKTPHIKKMEVC